MRSLTAVLTVAGMLLAFPGCSNKIELNPEKTVAFDPKRDGEPKTMGGPAGKTASKKKGDGVMAPPVEDGGK